MQVHQKQSDKFWKDEAGNSIPVGRLTDLEKLSEKTSVRLLKGATKLHEGLRDFKEEIAQLCDEIYEKSLEETNTSGKNRKGNFTWYNFNRTIKVEVSVNERIEFDDLKLQACKEKLDEFISQGTSGIDDFMKTLIMSAFEKTSGAIDTRKVLSLKKYKSRTKAPLCHEAMDLLDGAIRRPYSKRYFRIWLKNKEGKYENIDLNFSSI